MAMIRTNPYAMIRGGAIRGSNCRTIRMNFNRIGVDHIGGPRTNRFGGTSMTPGGILGRFELTSADTLGINSVLGTSMFTINSEISIINADGNGNATNTVGE